MAASISDNGVMFSDSSASPQQFSITAAVATNALTFTLQPSTISFRSATLATGGVTTVQNASALTLTVPASATLGTINATQARLVLLALNNAGTIELAVVNIAGGNQLDETNLISTTAISSAATSASVIYSASARTSVPYRVIGFVDITEATAGTWATAPTLVQGRGGQALAAMSSLGYGQTWQSVTRTAGTTYYNTTGKPIMVSCSGVCSGAGIATTLTVNGVLATAGVITSTGSASWVGIVPAGASYIFSAAAGGTVTSITSTTELR
jgi:hypothetical protein